MLPLLQGAGTGIRPDLISFNSAMKASKACQGRWCWSSDLLQRMQLAGSMPDSISLTSSIAAKGRGMQWRLALQGLYARSGRTIRQNVIICTAAVGACHAADEWLAALAVLGTMVLSAVEHDAMSQNWETHAYAGASQWAQALLPHALGATQNEFGSHLTLALAESGHQWQLALQMLRGSRQTSLKPTACDVSSAMTAATACARWPHALNLFTSSRLVLESQGAKWPKLTMSYRCCFNLPTSPGRPTRICWVALLRRVRSRWQRFGPPQRCRLAEHQYRIRFG